MNNPQAFPQSVISPGDSHVPEGATLLDLFANEAMQVMIPMFLTQGESYNIFNYDVIAKKAYEQANAMLKERENWIAK